MIRLDGWSRYNIWEHSNSVLELYENRARRLSEEMTCAAQAAELVKHVAESGDKFLDIGCGSGYFFHSLSDRNINLDYWGIDSCEDFIALGKSIMPDFGLPAERLIHGKLEDLNTQVDHILCMNVLSNLDNIHRPLERLLRSAQKTVILRESISEKTNYRYVIDNYLDSVDSLRVHVNTYALSDINDLGEELGFSTQDIEDRRSGGKPELVIDYPHHWTFVLMQKIL